ncbi:SRPBCC domain-containing protein [Streptomyces sp. NPDC054887]
MTEVIGRGGVEPHDGTDAVRFSLRLPYPAHEVWPAVATPGGLREWLAAADVLEPRLGGAVVLRWPDPGPGGGRAERGTVTAWDVEHVAEYTLDVLGRVRFHLEPALGHASTVLRFTHEASPSAGEAPASRLARWHQHFDYLVEALAGRPRDWSAWAPAAHRELYAGYEAAGGTQS